MTAKEELLDYFKGLDTSTLERLKNYSELLIIPEDDLVVNATAQQMVQKAHDLADEMFPQWTDRGKSDFGEFLIELMAMFSEKDFWYANAFANESLLRKTRSYANAYSTACSLGYEPTLTHSAKLQVSISPKTDFSLAAGDLVLRIGGYDYVNTQEVNGKLGSSLTVTLSEGTTVSEDAIFNGFSVRVYQKRIDIDSVEVYVGNVRYTRVGNFGGSTKTSKHFTVIPEEDGSVNVYFGKDGYGYTPPIGASVHLSYRKCKGSAPNGSLLDEDEFLVGNDLGELFDVSRQSSEQPYGGTDAEPLTSIQNNAPAYYSTRRTALNEVTMRKMLAAKQGVHSAVCWATGSVVNYSLIPSDGSQELPQEEAQEIHSDVSKCMLFGLTCEHVPNSYRRLIPDGDKILLDIFVLKGTNTKKACSEAAQCLIDLTSPLVRAEYGKGFTKNDADIYIRSKIVGVQSVTFKHKSGLSESILGDMPLELSEIFTPLKLTEVEVKVYEV